MEVAKTINYIIMILFFVCYSYQIMYVPIALSAKRKSKATSKLNRYAVLIAARNEEKVIGNLIDSLKEQKYPQDMFDIYVAADNCTDKTAAVASQNGATVFERFDNANVGKGFALKFLLEQIDIYSDMHFSIFYKGRMETD